jgi:hypothetical protein
MKILLWVQLLSDHAATQVKRVITITHDNRIALEYIKALASFPVVLMIMFLVLIFIYKNEIRKLIGNLESIEAAGAKASFNNEILAARLTDEVFQPEISKLDTLPPGLEKAQKTAELDTQIQSFENRLSEALENLPLTKVAEFINAPNSPATMAYHGATEGERIAEYFHLKKVLGDTIKEHAAATGSKVLVLPGGGEYVSLKDPDSLYLKCVAKDPARVSSYGKRLFMRVIYSLATEFMPREAAPAGFNPMSTLSIPS